MLERQKQKDVNCLFRDPPAAEDDPEQWGLEQEVAHQDELNC